MTSLIVVVFLVGYLLIAFEHPLKIDKAAPALVTGVLIWTIYAFSATVLVPQLHGEAFAAFLAENPTLSNSSLLTQAMMFVEQNQILQNLGEIAEILFFLIGAMTIVELIDVHGGFTIITNRITTRNKRKLLWILGFITFIMSAALDNLTTSIVMVTLLRKIIGNYKERWLYAAVIIIAANSGGAWSPIGDITTIMLWVRGNVTTMQLIPSLILPCLVSFALPTYIISKWLKGNVSEFNAKSSDDDGCIPQTMKVTRRERILILVLGVTCLLSVPIFKSITHLPPFMGILLALGVMWVYTEVMYKRKPNIPNVIKPRVSYVLRRVDTSTILFFLGILLAVGGLQVSGILSNVSTWLDTNIHNVYAIDLIIGGLSSVVDNVPLVAGSIATYPLADPAMVANAVDPLYASAFVQDGIFWVFLAYCAGVGGSMLIIGSAAGVVVMGLERINFVWYLKNISLMALVGYLCGAFVYIAQNWILTFF